MLLQCPECEGDYLHHFKVEVFNRTIEDSTEGVHVIVTTEDGEETEVTQNGDIRNNPSERRNGILVHFWCETCDCKPIFCIEQHKGNTLMAVLWK